MPFLTFTRIVVARGIWEYRKGFSGLWSARHPGSIVAGLCPVRAIQAPTQASRWPENPFLHSQISSPNKNRKDSAPPRFGKRSEPKKRRPKAQPKRTRNQKPRTKGGSKVVSCKAEGSRCHVGVHLYAGEQVRARQRSQMAAFQPPVSKAKKKPGYCRAFFHLS